MSVDLMMNEVVDGIIAEGDARIRVRDALAEIIEHGFGRGHDNDEIAADIIEEIRGGKVKGLKYDPR